MRPLISSNVIVGLGLLLAILTLLALGGLRKFYSAVSGQPNIAEQTITFATWLSTISIYFIVIPVLITLLRNNPIKVSWPVHEAFLFLLIILALAEFISVNRLFASDAALVAFCYLFFTISYVVSVARASNAMKARSWIYFIAASMAATLAGSAMFFIIWAILYFE